MPIKLTFPVSGLVLLLDTQEAAKESAEARTDNADYWHQVIQCHQNTEQETVVGFWYNWTWKGLAGGGHLPGHLLEEWIDKHSIRHTISLPALYTYKCPIFMHLAGSEHSLSRETYFPLKTEVHVKKTLSFVWGSPHTSLSRTLYIKMLQMMWEY